MPSVLDRSALEQSPLADLHLLANELGVDGFRRLRKPDLVDAILSRQSGEEVAEPRRRAEVEAVATPVGIRRRWRAQALAPRPARRPRPSPRRGRGRRRGSDRDRDEPAAAASPQPESRGGDERSVEGAVELLANGSGFLRLSPPEPTDDDVYISAAQVKRCELVSGDRVAGPMRAGAPVGALPVADPRRHDQRPPGRGGRRGHALRGPAGRLAGRAHPARQRGPDGQGDRVADAVRQGLARRDRRPVALGQVRGAAPAGRRAGDALPGSRSPRSWPACARRRSPTSRSRPARR